MVQMELTGDVSAGTCTLTRTSKGLDGNPRSSQFIVVGKIRYSTWLAPQHTLMDMQQSSRHSQESNQQQDNNVNAVKCEKRSNLVDAAAMHSRQ